MQDETTEWVDAGAHSPDAVQLGLGLVLHQGYPAQQFHTNQRAEQLLLGTQAPPPDSE